MCFEERKKPACIVVSLSVVVILCGFIMFICSIVFAAQQDDSISNVSDAAKSFANGSFATLLIFSMWAMAVGFSGTLCFCKWCAEGSICWPILYGVTLFVAWIIFLIMGSVVTSVSISGPEQIQAFCDGESSENVDWIRDSVDEIDSTINHFASQYMCSYLCPCEAVAMSPWLQESDETLNSFNRTKYPPTGTGTNSDWRYDAYGNLRLLGYDINDPLPPGRPRYFQNFTQCSDWLISEKEAARDDPDYETSVYYDMPSENMIEAGVSLLSYFEEKYTCSGVCDTALFYYALDLSEGVPRENCLANIKEEIGGTLSYLGVAALVCGIVMFFLWICQYALWKRYEPSKDEGFDNRN